MSDSFGYSEPRVPKSNAESVARDLVLGSIDFDGKRLADVFRTLLARAEEHHSIWACSGRSSQAMLAGEEPITQEAVNGQLLESFYETTCLKWFLACACKRLTTFLESDVLEKQTRFPRVKSIVYNADGRVERFDLETRGKEGGQSLNSE